MFAHTLLDVLLVVGTIFVGCSLYHLYFTTVKTTGIISISKESVCNMYFLASYWSSQNSGELDLCQDCHFPLQILHASAICFLMEIPSIDATHCPCFCCLTLWYLVYGVSCNYQKIHICSYPPPKKKIKLLLSVCFYSSYDRFPH